MSQIKLLIVKCYKVELQYLETLISRISSIFQSELDVQTTVSLCILTSIIYIYTCISNPLISLQLFSSNSIKYEIMNFDCIQIDLVSRRFRDKLIMIAVYETFMKKMGMRMEDESIKYVLMQSFKLSINKISFIMFVRKSINIHVGRLFQLTYYLIHNNLNFSL